MYKFKYKVNQKRFEEIVDSVGGCRKFAKKYGISHEAVYRILREMNRGGKKAFVYRTTLERIAKKTKQDIGYTIAFFCEV